MCRAFKKFLQQQKITPIEFCKKYDMAQPTVSKYLAGNRIPRKAEMLKIFQITNGAVTPNDFYDLPDLSAPSGDLQTDFFSSVSSSKVFPESRITPSGLDCQESCQPMGAGC